MKIKYVGAKDVERAFQEQTGLEWRPGDVHEVADEAMCERMLAHPDVFAAAGPASKPAAPPSPPDAAPPWLARAMELGCTDEQCQAIFAAGGPGTEAGAKAWTDFTGTEVPAEFKPKAAASAPSAPKKTAAKKAAAKPDGEASKPAAKKAATKK